MHGIGAVALLTKNLGIVGVAARTRVDSPHIRHKQCSWSALPTVSWHQRTGRHLGFDCTGHRESTIVFRPIRLFCSLHRIRRRGSYKVVHISCARHPEKLHSQPEDVGGATLLHRLDRWVCTRTQAIDGVGIDTPRAHSCLRGPAGISTPCRCRLLSIDSDRELLARGPTRPFHASRCMVDNWVL